MRIAVAVQNGSISAMDDAEKVLIYENGKFQMEHFLRDADEHPGLNKLVQVLPLGVNGIVTVHCGPPGFRLASSKGVGLYRVEGMPEDAVRKIESGEIAPIKEAQPGHDHHHHS